MCISLKTMSLRKCKRANVLPNQKCLQSDLANHIMLCPGSNFAGPLLLVGKNGHDKSCGSEN